MPEKPGGVGPMIAVIVIVIVLAIGGIYYLSQEVSRVRALNTALAL